MPMAAIRRRREALRTDVESLKQTIAEVAGATASVSVLLRADARTPTRPWSPRSMRLGRWGSAASPSPPRGEARLKDKSGAAWPIIGGCSATPPLLAAVDDRHHRHDRRSGGGGTFVQLMNRWSTTVSSIPSRAWRCCCRWRSSDCSYCAARRRSSPTTAGARRPQRGARLARSGAGQVPAPAERAFRRRIGAGDGQPLNYDTERSPRPAPTRSR